MMKTVSVIIPFHSHIDWLYEAIKHMFISNCLTIKQMKHAT